MFEFKGLTTLLTILKLADLSDHDEEVLPHHHSVYNKRMMIHQRNSRNACKAASCNNSTRYLHGD